MSAISAAASLMASAMARGQVLRGIRQGGAQGMPCSWGRRASAGRTAARVWVPGVRPLPSAAAGLLPAPCSTHGRQGESCGTRGIMMDAGMMLARRRCAIDCHAPRPRPPPPDQRRAARAPRPSSRDPAAIVVPPTWCVRGVAGARRGATRPGRAIQAQTQAWMQRSTASDARSCRGPHGQIAHRKLGATRAYSRPRPPGPQFRVPVATTAIPPAPAPRSEGDPRQPAPRRPPDVRQPRENLQGGAPAG